MGHLRGGLRLGPILLAVLLLGSAWPAAASGPDPLHGEPGLGLALDAMRQLATDSRSNQGRDATTRPRPGMPLKLGKDGRLTVLLLGSDWRPDAGGERLDVIMVATIDPTTGEAALVSIPRDMSGIPLAGGGNSGSMRVNSIYYLRDRDPALPHAALDRDGLKAFSRDIGTLLGTEIDYWALTRFGTFANLVNALGGVRVDVEEEVLDTSYHHGSSRGVWFPVQDDFLLKGDPKCKPKPKKCHSALVYARSRHGTMGGEYNSDYRRAERQQDIVRSAIRTVLDERGSGHRPAGHGAAGPRPHRDQHPQDGRGCRAALRAAEGPQAAGDEHEGPGTSDLGRRGWRRQHQAGPAGHPRLGGPPLRQGLTRPSRRLRSAQRDPAVRAGAWPVPSSRGDRIDQRPRRRAGRP